MREGLSLGDGFGGAALLDDDGGRRDDGCTYLLWWCFWCGVGRVSGVFDPLNRSSSGFTSSSSSSTLSQLLSLAIKKTWTTPKNRNAAKAPSRPNGTNIVLPKPIPTKKTTQRSKPAKMGKLMAKRINSSTADSTPTSSPGSSACGSSPSSIAVSLSPLPTHPPNYLLIRFRSQHRQRQNRRSNHRPQPPGPAIQYCIGDFLHPLHLCGCPE